MKLVVGLGNPGKKYERTRHNAGFWWVQRLARGAQTAWSEDSKFHGLVAQLSAPPEMRLLMPTTFMNHSGQAVAALAGFYKIPPQEILVVHDELDLPAGGVKLKYGGGISGHNGLRDIAAQLDSRDFWRLRIGIGHPRDSATSEQDVVDYVLHPPRAEEQAAIEDAIARSLEIWPMLAVGDEQGAMLKLHTKNDQSE